MNPRKIIGACEICGLPILECDCGEEIKTKKKG